MNKLLIGVLIVAAAAGAFILLRKKKDNPVTTELKKELIIGQWKPETASDKDSNFTRYRFDFLKDGQLLRTLNDSTAADTALYEWTAANELVWKEQAADTAGRTFAVLQLTQDSLQVQGKDSAIILFTKLK